MLQVRFGHFRNEEGKKGEDSPIFDFTEDDTVSPYNVFNAISSLFEQMDLEHSGKIVFYVSIFLKSVEEN